jgi:hypothetical protein
VKGHHKKFLEVHGFEAPPVNEWHHLFNPHSVPEVPLAELPPLPSGPKKSETVKDFLDRSQLPRDNKSLLLSALDQTAKDEEAKSQQQHLEAWSAKTGLSLDTLKLIQAKQRAIKEQKDHVDKTII